MKRLILSNIKRFDRFLSQSYLKHFSERNSLLIFLFHGIFKNNQELDSKVMYPLQSITVEHIRRLIEYYLEHDYTFVSPTDIMNGLKSDGRYILLSFDDGYANNLHVTPILNEYRVPAVFFVSTDHVQGNKCFWWDVVYRQGINKGTGNKKIIKQIMGFHSMKNQEIEKEIINRFGKSALRPVSDVDRPLTTVELREFSREPFIHIGNHTSDHAILTNYPDEEIRSQVLNAQKTLQDITGNAPIMISYPNGNYSKKVIDICREIGINLGVTIAPKKNYLPISPQSEASMRLGRFVLKGYNELEPQFKIFRSDFVLYNTIWNLVKS